MMQDLNKAQFRKTLLTFVDSSSALSALSCRSAQQEMTAITVRSCHPNNNIPVCLQLMIPDNPCFQCFICLLTPLSLLTTFELGTIIISVLQMSKLIPKEIQKLAQDYVAQKRKTKDVNPGTLLSAHVLLVLNSQFSGRMRGTKSSPSTHGLVPKPIFSGKKIKG